MQRFRKSFLSLGAGLIVAVMALVVGGAASTTPTTSTIAVPLFTQSTSTGSISHLRVINHSAGAGTVRILAHDDTGLPHGPVTLDIRAGDAVDLDAGDLEAGNTEKGLRSGVGAGTGAWRLELSSALDIEVLSYVRTQDGLVSGIQKVVRPSGHRGEG